MLRKVTARLGMYEDKLPSQAKQAPHRYDHRVRLHHNMRTRMKIAKEQCHRQKQ